MKRILITLAGLAAFGASVHSPAQTTNTSRRHPAPHQPDPDRQAGHRAAHAELNDAQVAAFTPIYDQYQAEMKVLFERGGRNLDKFAANFGSMTDDAAGEILKESFKIRDERNALMRKYARSSTRCCRPRRCCSGCRSRTSSTRCSTCRRPSRSRSPSDRSIAEERPPCSTSGSSPPARHCCSRRAAPAVPTSAATSIPPRTSAGSGPSASWRRPGRTPPTPGRSPPHCCRTPRRARCRRVATCPPRTRTW